MILIINSSIVVLNVNTSMFKDGVSSFRLFLHFQRVYRHSKSLNIEKDRCGKCLAKFELLLKNEMQTPKRTLTKYNLFIKEHFQRVKQTQPHLSTPQLMKHLSQEYKKQTQTIELPDLDQLNI